ncbi:MAG TPA: serine O-acetyltransferase [Leptospiraceae bacterium]|nr:serine O-acetyltransferase [Leptospiraceae bacterium]HMW05204.1 serine O-acetyltransferase [Leptospiraceae bacterium]HMY32137.1 serine O-acetyltransferase [Leptospiraceae bacterium]HMZ63482.1 serine O-acetyltransferase [Leptospiraceae bacterium]HNA05499.1 serine O-acetyltransferase [Leptospiraceae bacterium]
MFDNIRKIKDNDPAAKSYLEVILCYPGLHALWFHSIAHFLYKCKVPLLPRMLNYIARFLTGIDIHPGAKIASGIMIDHGMGVVIGETAEIGTGCLIYQGVTLGGTGKESGKRHPTLKENVVVGSGAKVLGNIILENNVRVGAGSVVMRDVPANCTVVGIPGRVVKSEEKNSEHMLDHGQMPDPVARVFSILLERIDTLQQEIAEISHEKSNKKDQRIVEDKLLQNFIYGEGI